LSKLLATEEQGANAPTLTTTRLRVGARALGIWRR